MAITVDLSLNSFIARLVDEVHHFRNAQMCAAFYSLFARSCPDVWNALEDGHFSEKFAESIVRLSARRLHECEILHLELFVLIGFLRSNPNDIQPCMHKLGDLITSRLLTPPITLTVMAITLAKLWWTLVITFCPTAEHPLFELATNLCLMVLFHTGSDDRFVSDSAITFLDHVLTNLVSMQNSDLRSWINEKLVGDFIMSHPVTQSAPTILSKSALRCLPSVLKHLGLIKVFSLSPHLTTSLFISVGHNYTAAAAAGVLLELLDSCSVEMLRKVDSLVPALLQPIVSYILFANLNCTSAQMCCGSSEITLDTVQVNRRVNFAHHCIRKKFLRFRLPTDSVYTLFPSTVVPSVNDDSSLVELLLNSLDSLLQTDCTDLSLHRQYFWEFLFAAHEDKFPLILKNLHLSPLFHGLYHSDDLICSLAFRGLTILAVNILKHSNTLSDTSLSDPLLITSDRLMDFFTFGITNLIGSTNPVARKYLSDGFEKLILTMEMTLSATGSSSFDALTFNEALNTLVPLDSCATAQSDASQKDICSLSKGLHLSFQWLPHLFDLLSKIWGSSLPDASRPDFARCGRLVFSPGMTYQRAKNTLNLMRSSIHLRNLHNSDEKWLAGCVSCWESQSLNMLETLLYSLPLLTSDLQLQLLEVVGLNWPNGSILLPDDRCDLLVTRSLQWCCSHVTSVYTAGANLLTFCCSRGYLAKSSMRTQIGTLLAENLNFLCSDEYLHNPVGGLLSSILKSSGLGYLLAIAQLLNIQSEMITTDLLRYLHSTDLAHCCLHIISQCLELMGTPAYPDERSTHSGQVPITQSAPSFRHLSQSILRAVSHGSYRDKTSDNHFDGPHFSTGIELLPEYQHILSWAWNALKLSADVLSHWVVAVQSSLFKGDRDGSVLGLCTTIGYQLVHILLACRHRGTVEAVCNCLQLYLSVAPLFSSKTTSRETGLATQTSSCTHALISCEEVLNICWEVLCHCRYSTTRRAAGLWPAVRAALYAEQSQRGRQPHLLTIWIERMFSLFHPKPCEIQNVLSSEDLSDPPEALALHILRGIFLDARLKPHSLLVPGNPSRSFIVHALEQVVLPSFGALDWTVSNAALQLHAALVLRLTGTDTGRPRLSTMEIFTRYDGLLTICLNGLEEAMCQSDKPSVTPTLASLLSLLVRFNQGIVNVCASITRMRYLLEHLLLTHRSSSVRKLAAAAYLSLAPPSGPSQHTCCSDLPYVAMVGPVRLLRTSKAPPLFLNFTANALHGQLCLLLAWLEQPTGQPVFLCRRSHFDWDQALKLLDHLLVRNHPNPAAFYLSHCLCDVLSIAFDSRLPTADFVRTKFVNWMDAHSSQFLTLSNTQFHEECVLSLHALAKRMTGGIPYIQLTFLSQVEPVRLSRFMHTYGEDDDTLLQCVPIVVRYWLDHVKEVASCPFLALHFVELWSTAIVHRIPSVVEAVFPSEEVLCILHTLLNQNNTDFQDSLLRAQILVCAALFIVDKDSLCPPWWAREIFSCILPHRPETTRIFAVEALLMWQERFHDSQSHTSHVPLHPTDAVFTGELEQRNLILHAMLLSVFDECAEVRSRVGILVDRYWGKCRIPQPLTHVIAANALLDELLPLWLPTCEMQMQWLLDVWNWNVENLCQRIAEETLLAQRNALYELEPDNAFCEPRLLLELIFRKMWQQTPNEKDRACLSCRLRENSERILREICDTHNIGIEQLGLPGHESDRCTPLHEMSPAMFTLSLCLNVDHSIFDTRFLSYFTQAI